jgi:hypothetical protein
VSHLLLKQGKCHTTIQEYVLIFTFQNNVLREDEREGKSGGREIVKGEMLIVKLSLNDVVNDYT